MSNPAAVSPFRRSTRKTIFKVSLALFPAALAYLVAAGHLADMLLALGAGGLADLLPAGRLNELQSRTLGIFVFAAISWAIEALPLYATSLAVVATQILLLAKKGGLAGDIGVVGGQAISYKDFFDPFASSIIILFMGGFLLGRAVSKHNVDTVIAARMLSPFSRRPLLLVFAVLGMTAFFSMWMSNTATAAMMLALIAPVLRSLPSDDRYHRAVILAVPFGANIGGIGTPIGTPPNAIAYGFLRANGIEVGFLKWMMLTVPLMVLMLIVCGLLLYWAFRPKTKIEMKPVHAPDRLHAHGWVTIAILVGTLTLWLTGEWTGINVGVVALLAAAALTALGVLERRDVDSVDWNILLLMWGGLALGAGLERTGLAEAVVAPLGNMSGIWLTVMVATIALLLSTFMSHTAASSLLIPMVFALSVATGGNRSELVIMAALACSFAMAVPVSTPPNAMAFSTGKVPAVSMIRVGTLVSLIGLIVMLLGYKIMLPLVLGK